MEVTVKTKHWWFFAGLLLLVPLFHSAPQGAVALVAPFKVEGALDDGVEDHRQLLGDGVEYVTELAWRLNVVVWGQVGPEDLPDRTTILIHAKEGWIPEAPIDGENGAVWTYMPAVGAPHGDWRLEIPWPAEGPIEAVIYAPDGVNPQEVWDLNIRVRGHTAGQAGYYEVRIPQVVRNPSEPRPPVAPFKVEGALDDGVEDHRQLLGDGVEYVTELAWRLNVVVWGQVGPEDLPDRATILIHAKEGWIPEAPAEGTGGAEWTFEPATGAAHGDWRLEIPWPAEGPIEAVIYAPDGVDPQEVWDLNIRVRGYFEGVADPLSEVVISQIVRNPSEPRPPVAPFKVEGALDDGAEDHRQPFGDGVEYVTELAWRANIVLWGLVASEELPDRAIILIHAKEGWVTEAPADGIDGAVWTFVPAIGAPHGDWRLEIPWPAEGPIEAVLHAPAGVDPQEVWDLDIRVQGHFDGVSDPPFEVVIPQVVRNSAEAEYRLYLPVVQSTPPDSG
jgi:hypothetical protein